MAADLGDFPMAAGITCTAVLMAFLTEMLISRRLNHAIGRRRGPGMSGHVVVGLGAFGIHLAGALVAAGKPVVVIERGPENGSRPMRRRSACRSR